MGWFRLSEEEKARRKEEIAREKLERTPVGNMMGTALNVCEPIFFVQDVDRYKRARPVTKWQAVLSSIWIPFNLVGMGFSLLRFRTAKNLADFLTDTFDIGQDATMTLSDLETQAKYQHQKNSQERGWLQRLFYRPSVNREGRSEQEQVGVDRRLEQYRASQRVTGAGKTLEGARNQKERNYLPGLNQYTAGSTPSVQRGGVAERDPVSF